MLFIVCNKIDSYTHGYYVIRFTNDVFPSVLSKYLFNPTRIFIIQTYLPAYTTWPQAYLSVVLWWWRRRG